MLLLRALQGAAKGAEQHHLIPTVFPLCRNVLAHYLRRLFEMADGQHERHGHRSLRGGG